jgi:glycosyltransferase involved in cell wall biosynthesis
MSISVILCSYNRCQRLAKALESVAVSKVSEPTTWEVLVVDNNSNDQTREVAEDFCRRFPGRFRYSFEPQPGKSHALNTGIRESRADILAFMDDDVTVEPTWLQNLTASLQNGEWVGTGGRILPEQGFRPPYWLSVERMYAMGPLVIFDLGPEVRRLTESPLGTNMAFRKEVFEKHGGFRTDLGPRPGSEIRNEDTEFGSRLLTAGEPLRYEPSAVVYHLVPESRVQRKYFLDWWFDKGRADVIQFGIPPGSWCVAGIPLYLFRRIAVWSVRWIVEVSPRPRFEYKLKVWGKVGEVLESYRTWAEAGKNRRPSSAQS